MKKYLISIETVKIKDFIFNTNKLKVIRGASYLLDYLNQVKMPELLNNLEIKEEDILYIAAGNAKFYAHSEDKSKEIIEKAKAIYKEYAPGAKLVGSYLEVGEGKKDWDVIDELAKVTAKEKSKGFPEMNIDLPFVEKCMICNDKPVEVKKNNTDLIEKYENLYIVGDKDVKGQTKLNKVLGSISNNEEFKSGKSGICSGCLAKLVAATYIKQDSEKVGIYHRREELEGFVSGETIEDYKNNKSFIGFVYADGDSLGDFLKNSKEKYKKTNDEKGYRIFMKEFSEALDRNTKDAFIDTLIELKEKFPKKMIDSEEKILYGEFLIVGGDDVCGIFHADVAMEVSTLFQKKLEAKMVEFEEKHRDFSGEKRSNITASSGVVIAKSKTPLFYLFDQSLKLQKSAKAKRYEEANKEGKKKATFNKGYVDFQVIGSEGTTDISKFREDLGEVMERPYLVDGEKQETEVGIDKLERLISNLKIVKFPKNKIRKFYELKKSCEHQESLFEFLNLVSRLDKESRSVMFSDWAEIEDLEDVNFLKENLKNIFDVLEMYDFVGGTK